MCRHCGAETSTHEQLGRAVSILKRCGSVCKQSHVRISCLFQQTLYGLYCSLSLAIALWEFGATGKVFEPICRGEGSECLAGELRAVVRHEHLRDAVSGKHRFQMVNHIIAFCVCQQGKFDVPGEVINDEQVSFSPQFKEIGPQLLPWALGAV